MNPAQGASQRSASSGLGAADSCSDPDAAGQGTRGAAGLAARPIPSIAPASLPEWLTQPRGRVPDSARRGKTHLAAHSGRRGPLRGSGGIDWFATLARGKPSSTHQLRRRTRRSQSRQLWIVALDCSASMQRGRALALAKGIARALEARALSAGAHLALISFRGERARTELTSRPGRTAYAHSVSQLTAAGGTPLASALNEAFRISRDRRWCSREVDKRLILLTDGRTREALALTAQLPAGLELTVIDCERTSLRLGRAATIARSLAARYIHVDELGMLS